MIASDPNCMFPLCMKELKRLHFVIFLSAHNIYLEHVRGFQRSYRPCQRSMVALICLSLDEQTSSGSWYCREGP